jgi:DNA invertase Pin-like site-specific DNA recombinase
VKKRDKKREGDAFISPEQQRQRVEEACRRDGLRLLRVVDELDVSGGTALEERTGLRQAVEAIEAGEADVIVAAYFDRLVRSLKVQGEVVQRIERAGGQVLAVDVGRVTEGSAGQWLSGVMLGAVSEYHRRTAKERSAEAQARAVARGVLPWPNVTPGYLRGDDGGLTPDPETALVIDKAFRMRAEGATIKEVRAFLRSHDIERSFHGVTSLLASRVVLGEIRFGDLVNSNAHEPIVDEETWRAVQRRTIPRGRRAASDRLLARLGVLRCGSCNARMIIGTSKGTYASYRCPPTGDCTNRLAISADIAERVVSEHVRVALADENGHASAEANIGEAEQALADAQGALDSALRAFDGFDEPAARQRFLELRDARDAAQTHLDQLGGKKPAITINGAADWDALTLAERRALIRATVERAVVHPGRGADRITVEFFA